MQVILLEKVKHLGQFGQEVKVKPGFGRNYLIPRGKALIATPGNRKVFEARRSVLESESQHALAQAQARAEILTGLSVQLVARAGDAGKLYGSIRASDIVEALALQKIQMKRQELLLPNGPIHDLGEHTVILNLHTQVQIPVTVTVTSLEKS